MINSTHISEPRFCNFYIIDLVSVLADLNRKDMKIKVEIDFVTA